MSSPYDRVVLMQNEFAQLILRNKEDIAATFHPAKDGVSATEVESFAAGLMNYPVIYWKHELWNVAISGSETFIGHRFADHMFVPPMQVWLYDADLQIRHEAIDALPPAFHAHDINAAVIVHTANKAIHFIALLLSSSELAKARSFDDIHPMMFRTSVLKNAPTESGAALISVCEFLKLKIVEIKQTKPDRAERRRLAREGTTKFQDVRVVYLRRTQHDTYAKKLDDAPHLVDWKYQWLVRPHWRNQYYPSTQEHRPVFICEYLKGPVDRPLKTPTKSIFAVVR